jgi:alkanesulfonate monooxygenase SsuD/methylene tetrahydromethanopterin reductase-like flavin-dependent oxidoreductase (luciferase family)
MFRHPSVLAAEAVTVDHVSGGRLDMTLGAGSVEREHLELGLEFPGNRERAERLEEAVQVVRLLMTEDDVTFDGRHYRLEGATFRPRPVQQPHPPIWIGAGGDRATIPIAARQADVWHCFNDLDELPGKVAVFDAAAEAAGRDPASVLKAASITIDDDWTAVEERVRTLAGLGFGYVVVQWPDGGDERVEEFAHRVMPRLL